MLQYANSDTNEHNLLIRLIFGKCYTIRQSNSSEVYRVVTGHLPDTAIEPNISGDEITRGINRGCGHRSRAEIP